MSARAKHGSRRRWAGIAANLLVLVLSAALAGCGDPSPTPVPTATPLPTVSILPKFSGWRAAYLDSDGYLRAIALSDHSELTGMRAPWLEDDTLLGSIISAGASPDGGAIAYALNSRLYMLDLARHHVVTTSGAWAGEHLWWSPNSAHLAAQEVPNRVRLLDRATGTLSDITPAGLKNPTILGWRSDGALIFQTADHDYTVVTLWAEDIQTKLARQIVQIPVDRNIGPITILIAPNGAAGVLSTWRTQDTDFSFTPLVATIDLTTGARHPLPNIARITGADVDYDTTITAWRQDDTQVALGQSREKERIWILDLVHDTATHVADGVYPVGWAPDGSGLILSTISIPTSGEHSHTLSLLSLPVTGPATPTRLTDHAYLFPFLGFVRGD